MGQESYTQKGRPLALTTDCGEDVLLLTGFSGHEAISQLYNFRAEAVVTDLKLPSVKWDALLGKEVTVELRETTSGQVIRYFSGLCNRVSQGERAGGDQGFTQFRLEIVPKLWQLSRRASSRVFHHESVKSILMKVLGEHGITPGWLADSPTEPRDYCVQYRETDFNFVSRLLEEEGLCYYFEHKAKSHKMIISGPPKEFPTTSPAAMKYHPLSGGTPEKDTVSTWEKLQELRSGKYALRDHHFEKTGDVFPSVAEIKGTVTVGAASHNLKLGNGSLELHDYPGEFAQRFDGIDKSGGVQGSEIGKIAGDGKRTAAIRMEEEAASAVVIQGGGNGRQFTAGYRFTLQAPATMAHAAGNYVLTSVQHVGRQDGTYASGVDVDFQYQNSFACMPEGLPFRPARLTPKPVVHGTQTATVVGNADGDEIFTDKFGRVKVKFHWDETDDKNANCSCWLRVGTLWAGAQWGAIHIPRVGQEVLVAFQEGDPDMPIVVGSVYNDQQMPPYTLPDNKTQSGLKTRSTLKGTPKNFNELRFEDKKDNEHIYFHAERDFHRVVENNDTLKVGRSKQAKGDQTVEIFNNQTTQIGDEKADDGSQTITVFNDQTLTVGDAKAKSGCQTITVYKDRTETVKTGNEKVTIEKGNRDVNVQTGNDTHKIDKGNRTVEIGMGNDALTIKMGNRTTKLDLGKDETEAMQSIELKVGQSSIKLDQMGVTIKGMMIKVEGQIQTEVKGLMTQVSGTAMTTIKGAITMIN